MPRKPFVDTVVAAFIGRPMPSFEPPPTSAIGSVAAVASVSSRENSRSSTGRMLASTASVLIACWVRERTSRSSQASSRSFLRGLTALEREDLGRVQQPLRIEHGLDSHLHDEIGLGELDVHQVALLDADAVLAGEAAAGGDAQLEDLMTRLLGPIGLRRIVGVKQDQGVQVAVAGVEDVS